MVVGCLVIQLVVVFVQHKGKKRVLAGQMLIVLTGLKPGFDAYNVCSGKEHSVMDANRSGTASSGLASFHYT